MKGFNIGLVLYVDSQFLVTACIMAVVFTLTGVTEYLPTWVITLYFFGLYGFFAYEAEIEKLKNTHEKNKQALYKAEKTIGELTTAIEKASVEHEKEKQELNDLRELVFALTNDADSAAGKDTKTQVEFPYHTTMKHIVFGGHPSWLKAIRPMIPDVKFVDGVPSTEQIKGAEIVWLQTNYLSHKAFYKIIDIVRSKNIPLRYFTSASATKCAEQVVDADLHQ